MHVHVHYAVFTVFVIKIKIFINLKCVDADLGYFYKTAIYKTMCIDIAVEKILNANINTHAT